VAGASFLSAILGNNALAETSNVEAIENSQSIAILSANISSASVITKKKEENEVTGSLSGSIVEDTALMAGVTPNSLKSIGGPELEDGDIAAEDMSVYVVRKGDTIGQIAEMFDVSVNTILWANDLKKGAPLKEGDTLLILPISGVQHTVAKGETLATIAKKYKVDTITITSFNGLDINAVLAVGDELIIPDAEMPNDAAPSTKPGSKPGIGIVKNGPSKVISGFFINPVPELKRKSQGLHGKNGVDLAAPTGTRVLASGPGKVIFAKYGWNGAYGNLVILQHANGTKTLYAHLSQINVSSGQQVDRGQVIGLVGSTGRSTGPHLHFEVHGAKNPGADWSWAKQ
jgi:murein DD-endopeptidase MepM/ murein hydrolase activator NlpD